MSEAGTGPSDEQADHDAARAAGRQWDTGRHQPPAPGDATSPPRGDDPADHEASDVIAAEWDPEP